MVEIREASDQIWLVGVMKLGMGFFGQGEDRVERADNPVIAEKVLAMSPEQGVNDVTE